MAKKATKSKAKTTTRSGAKAPKLSFDNAALVKKLLAEVPERAREVLVYRFGLGASPDRETLEAIGERWSITRERVRQIEASGIEAIRHSRAFREYEGSFEELRAYIEAQGAIVPEDVLLADLASDEKTRNRFRFLLVVGSAFFRERERMISMPAGTWTIAPRRWCMPRLRASTASSTTPRCFRRARSSTGSSTS
jgi:hypothetical protein